MHQAAIGMGDNIRVEIEIDFGSAKNNGIHHRSKVALTVIVVRSEGRCRYMPRIAGDRAHSVEIKGLAVEDIVGESFFEQFNEEFGDRKSTRLNSSHPSISYAVFCLKKKKKTHKHNRHR